MDEKTLTLTETKNSIKRDGWKEPNAKLYHLLNQYDLSENQKTTIITRNKTYTIADTKNLVNSIIKILFQFKVKSDQRIVLISDHNEDTIFFLLAASAIGLQILMPYNLENTACREWVNIIENSKPDHVIYLKKNDSHIRELKNLSCSVINLDIANMPIQNNLVLHENGSKSKKDFLILFTSGSTGLPKAICISERLICFRIASVSKTLKFNHHSRIFMSGLMNNTTGFIFAFGSLLHKSTLYIPSDRNIMKWPLQVESLMISHIMLRPLILKQFLDSVSENNLKLPSLKILAYGASAVSIQTLEMGRKLLSCEWIQGYGLSETFGPFSWLTEKDHQAKIYKNWSYCVGKPETSLQVALDNIQENGVGEIKVKGNYLMEGYYNIHNNTIQKIEEWFHTGDYGEFKNDYLILKGRIANTLLTKNGHRIYPEEVEYLLRSIPEVTDAILICINNQNENYDNLGNDPIACISGHFSKCETDIVQLVKGVIINQLSKEKWPIYLYIHQGCFPKNSNDKINKTALIQNISPDSLIDLFKEERDFL